MWQTRFPKVFGETINRVFTKITPNPSNESISFWANHRSGQPEKMAPSIAPALHHTRAAAGRLHFTTPIGPTSRAPAAWATSRPTNSIRLPTTTATAPSKDPRRPRPDVRCGTSRSPPQHRPQSHKPCSPPGKRSRRNRSPAGPGLHPPSKMPSRPHRRMQNPKPHRQSGQRIAHHHTGRRRGDDQSRTRP